MDILQIIAGIFIITMLLNILMISTCSRVMNKVSTFWAFLYVLFSPATLPHNIAVTLSALHEERHMLDQLSIEMEDCLLKWRTQEDYILFVRYMATGDIEDYIQENIGNSAAYIEVVAKAIEDDVLLCRTIFKTVYLSFNREKLNG